MWDMLPLAVPATASILRLDHLFPIGADPANWQTEPYRLSPEAMPIFDDWIVWLTTGQLRADSELAFAREALRSL